jgi:mRNA-degrading endonuclease RelE of RelBE toxin-antitoxin system
LVDFGLGRHSEKRLVLMTLEAEHTRLFEKQFKKLHGNEQKLLDGIIDGLRQNPPPEDEHHLKGALQCCNAVEIPRLPGECRLVIRLLIKTNQVHLVAFGPHRTVYDEAGRYVTATGLQEVWAKEVR